MVVKEDLMIGDWCISPDLNKPARYTGHYYQMGQQIEGGPYTRLTFLYEGGREGTDIPECRVMPIPLTTEILRKNHKVLCDRNFKVEKYFSREGCLVTVSADYEDAYLTDIQYVHELQHLLKLLGIKEEIEL